MSAVSCQETYMYLCTFTKNNWRSIGVGIIRISSATKPSAISGYYSGFGGCHGFVWIHVMYSKNGLFVLFVPAMHSMFHGAICGGLR